MFLFVMLLKVLTILMQNGVSSETEYKELREHALILSISVVSLQVVCLFRLANLLTLSNFNYNTDCILLIV